MAGTRKSFGPRLDRNFLPRGIGRVDRVEKVPKAGLYPKREDGAGEYGTRAYPSVIESYDRASDYRRWKLGQELYYTAGANWASLVNPLITRKLDGTGITDLSPGGTRMVMVQFPSLGSPEGAWYTGIRVRGSIMFPAPLDSSHISLDQSDPDPANHRLVYDCSSFYSTEELATLSKFVGSQFEDTAIGPDYPNDLEENPSGGVGLTLVAVDPASKKIYFDISRPYVRVRPNKQLYWHKERYRPDLAIPVRQFRSGEGRHLCSSFKFFCSCPDFLGASVANMEKPRGGSVDRFPVPSSGRAEISAWESDGAGYFRQWRSMPTRCDERRECKHIHCLRWECNVPWLEPEDYPTSGSRQSLVEGLEQAGSVDSDQTAAYFSSSQAYWSRFALPVADLSGLAVFPGGDPRQLDRPSSVSIFWNDARRPESAWCRHNDWWLERGKKEVLVFNEQTMEFERQVIKGGDSYPVIEFTSGAAPGAPLIVR